MLPQVHVLIPHLVQVQISVLMQAQMPPPMQVPHVRMTSLVQALKYPLVHVQIPPLVHNPQVQVHMTPLVQVQMPLTDAGAVGLADVQVSMPPQSSPPQISAKPNIPADDHTDFSEPFLSSYAL